MRTDQLHALRANPLVGWGQHLHSPHLRSPHLLGGDLTCSAAEEKNRGNLKCVVSCLLCLYTFAEA